MHVLKVKYVSSLTGLLLLKLPHVTSPTEVNGRISAFVCRWVLFIGLLLFFPPYFFNKKEADGKCMFKEGITG